MASKTRRKCPQCGKVWIPREGSENYPETVCIGCRGRAIAEALAKTRRTIEKERKNSDRTPARPIPTYYQIKPYPTKPAKMATYTPSRDYEPYVEYGGNGGGGGNIPILGREHIRLPPPIEVLLEPQPVDLPKPKKPRKPRKKKEKPAPPKKRDKWETVKV
jgi:hypothetical protein